MVTGESTRLAYARHQMDQPQYVLDARRRQAVLAAIIDRCQQRAWTLAAAHVRTNHVHVVVTAEPSPERVMNDLKSFASRCLNELGFESPDRKRWARHGSTRWLNNRNSVARAIRYVAEGQGEPMALFVRS